MMIENSREGFQAKEEGDNTINIEKFSRAASTSRQWSGFRNPRIVRVSRTFGGKDRHSKVCTIRGLRDRRIRLSVPTAIQLYDLQDRLGLSQPSKVIDWLLEATKNDIDKLPPLQIPPNFGQFHQQTFFPHHMHESFSASQPSLGTFFDASSALLKDGENQSQNLMSRSRFWNTEAFSRLKGIKEDERGSINNVSEKGKWIKTTNEEEDDEGEDGMGEYRSSQVNSAQKLFPIVGNHASLPGNMLNVAMTYNSFHSDPSSLSLSQFGSHGLFPSQLDPHSTSSNGVQFPAPLAVPSTSQFLFGPPSATPPLFASPYMTASAENDPRQFNLNQIQFLSSSNSQVLPHPLIPSSINSPLRPFPASPFSSKLLGSDDTNGRGQPDNKNSTSRS